MILDLDIRARDGGRQVSCFSETRWTRSTVRSNTPLLHFSFIDKIQAGRQGENKSIEDRQEHRKKEETKVNPGYLFPLNTKYLILQKETHTTLLDTLVCG